MISLETKIMALLLVALSSLMASENKSMKAKRILPRGLGTGMLLSSWDYTCPGPGVGRTDGRRGRRRQVVLVNHKLLSFLQMNSTE